MIVNFDRNVQWQNVPASFMGYDKIHMAAPPPHKVILVVMPALANEIDRVAGNLFRSTSSIYDCSIGWHDGTEYTDFVLPEFAGYRHTKITVRARRPLLVPTKQLSEIMNYALAQESERDERWHGVHTAVKVPNALWVAANQLAKLEFGDQPQAILDLINTAMLEYLENHNRL